MKTTGQNAATAVGKEPEGGADSRLHIHAERRACRRIPANLQARLFYGNLIYTGTVTNLSEKGMFISTKVRFPVNSVCIMLVLVNGQVVKIPVKVRRTAAREGAYSPDSGMGVELVNAPQNYLDYVSACQASA
ncbi:MAG: PilZ domain-containing protein [Deferribacteres bacterium]|nr:PilZ domain-containing protein [Deferribacteres bacterium]